MKKDTNSRLENSKQVRRILNRFGADLTLCSYSVSGREICLTGILLKTDGSDFGGQEVEYMIDEFQALLRGFVIRGHLENWSFSADHISEVGKEAEAEVETDEQEVAG